jgi:hypothetical protein
MRSRLPRLGLLSGLLAFALPGQLAALQLSPPGSASGLPPQSACPVVANVDLRRIARRATPAPVPYVPSPDVAEVVLPAWASRRPPPDASIVIRVRLPAGGGYARDERAVVWREADGSWWGWRHVLNGNPVSPPSPPYPGSPEEAERARDTAAGYPWLYDPAPTYEGRLDPEQSAVMEAAFADPCRRLEPDVWPWEIPLLRRVEGKRIHRCQLYQDSTFYRAEFSEPGRPPRAVGLRCGSAGSLNAVLVTHTAHVELPARPPRRLTRDEIDALRARGVRLD